LTKLFNYHYKMRGWSRQGRAPFRIELPFKFKRKDNCIFWISSQRK